MFVRFKTFHYILQCLMLKMRPSDASKGWDDMHTKGVCVARFRQSGQCESLILYSEIAVLIGGFSNTT